MAQHSSISADEIERFSGFAEDWWNPAGPMRLLHRLNPVRIAYVRDRILQQGYGSAGARESLRHVSILDVGCGSGLLSEPLARLGAKVTGLDASEEAITEARRHAAQSGLDIDYRTGSAEEFVKGKQRFDVITALEIVEHVADLDSFFASLAKLLKPEGLLIVSTINRTPKSFLRAIVAAEYVLRWVPKGTHRWSKFPKPSEIVRKLEDNGLTAIDATGVLYDPLKNEFRLSKSDLSVNYMLAAVKG